MTESEQIAQFLTTRGVTRIAAGERTVSEREMYRARRGQGRGANGRAITETDRLIGERHVTYDHAGRAWVANGLGEVVSVD